MILRLFALIIVSLFVFVKRHLEKIGARRETVIRYREPRRRARM